MPNTLAHFGSQGILQRLGFPEVDPRWILFSCIIPDLPWIGQRVLRMLELGVDPFAFRLYAVGQASLLVCLLLCGALAAVSTRSAVVFAVLGAGSVLHLAIDAMQTKLGNGVHFLVPFHWEEVNLGWFWPESWVSYALTAMGLLYVAHEWRRQKSRTRGSLFRVNLRRAVTSLVFSAGYLLVPLALMGPLERADVHSVATLRDEASRPGRAVALDRQRAVPGEAGLRVYTFAGEQLRVVGGASVDEPGTVSLEGTFEDPKTIRAIRFHRHDPMWRRWSSYLGLSLLLLFWIRPVVAKAESNHLE